MVHTTNKRYLTEKTWTWLIKGNLERETESLLIEAQKNAITTNHIKARIDKTQQNSKCKLYGDRDEIISECCKLARLSGQGDPLRILQEISF